MSDASKAVIAYSLTDLDGKVLAQRNSHHQFYAASTIKLGVLIAVLRRVDAGTLSLDDLLVSKHTFLSRIEGAGEFEFVPDEIDHGMPAVGQEVLVRETLRRMVVVSSNEATNMLVEIVGLDEVNATFAALGAKNSFMTRMIGDYAARKAGFSHETTAADLVTVMRAITTGQAAGEQSTKLMVEFLAEQEFPVIADSLGTETAWGSKSGWVDFIHHDAAFIGSGPTQKFLAVCTSGIEVGGAMEAIRAVAAALTASAETRSR